MHYFNYEVYYVMNITDIDDKIIRRARRQYLFTQYVSEMKEPRSQLLADLSSSIEVINDIICWWYRGCLCVHADV